MFVIKRSTMMKQEYDLKKVRTTIDYATKNLSGVSAAELERRASMQFINNIKTTDIQQILIRTAADLISEERPNYQFVASRLMIGDLRKEVWGSFLPKESLYNRIKDRINNYHCYDDVILDKYSEEEMADLENEVIVYDRDFDLTYSGIRQFYDKYLTKNRKTNAIYELPQEANILICMYMFKDYPSDERKKYVKEMYDKLSTFLISLPTPIYAGVRSNMRQFSSCCVIDCGDNTNSILSTNYIIGKATTKRFGLGVHIGKIRGVGASVSNGTVIHTGVVPFLKMFEATTKGFVQNGLRGGGGTISFPFWHWEVETLLELKNNKGVVENRVRSLDYSIGLNKFFLQRALKNDFITLFSSEEVPLLANDYRHSFEEFTRIYTEYEAKEGIRKKRISALDMLKKIATERFETGRIYVYFMDNMNDFGVFKESIYSSNLCQEIALPTTPSDILSGEGLVSVCILSCINVGRLKNFGDLEQVSEIIVRFLDEMIDYQDYEFPQLRESAVKYRPLGIGISDLFHLLARKGLKYNSKETYEYVHRLMEHFQYSLLNASCKLAKEKGPCEYFERSKYSSGYLPIDEYKRSIDTLGDFKLECDWERLRDDIKKYGLRNTCLSAIPPTASSSSISNSTPGIDPPKSVATTKMSKYGTFKQIAPDYDLYKESYQFQKDVKSTEYFKLIGVIQKFIDQGISTNSFYMSDDDVSIGDVVKEITTAYSYGLKSLYYLNSNKGTDKDVKQAMSTKGIGAKSSQKQTPAPSTYVRPHSHVNANAHQFEEEDSSSDNYANATTEDEDEGCAGGACSI
ncbi:Ribonucleoside-diphosphate reductase subunit alpha [Tritrichomonas foetus]|uniref:Ribonucleoside-diphosphate reductase n=1 Tax=Tritrichomonas foetus TaxID=1144522 RepID=A0A1J4K6G5_9EUKA|nr:Ribonucleoside-diphosphate reductase subunit alpha [Tritrichomonas foetus]|eukprot:OHT06983.1 Ribonucleoside-diphosphate reductase subunit alpha [Tritrichomonas foetus]